MFIQLELDVDQSWIMCMLNFVCIHMSAYTNLFEYTKNSLRFICLHRNFKFFFCLQRNIKFCHFKCLNPESMWTWQVSQDFKSLPNNVLRLVLPVLSHILTLAQRILNLAQKFNPSFLMSVEQTPRSMWCWDAPHCTVWHTLPSTPRASICHCEPDCALWGRRYTLPSTPRPARCLDPQGQHSLLWTRPCSVGQAYVASVWMTLIPLHSFALQYHARKPTDLWESFHLGNFGKAGISGFTDSRANKHSAAASIIQVSLQ
jgi:hypothetical protein